MHKWAIVFVLLLTVSVAGCRETRGGPGEEHTITVIEPTPAVISCVEQDTLPADAPRFEDIDTTNVILGVDGLGIHDITDGTGQTLEDKNKTVRVRYSLWLDNGCLLDSSYERGTDDNAAAFMLENVIDGFSEGMIGMNEGGERRIIIPPILGYGEAGAPPRIPGNATLHFYIQLLNIVEPEADTITAQTFCISPEDLPEDAPGFEDVDVSTITLRNDGLGVQDVSEGTGQTVEEATDLVVRMRYSGWLDDGCLFDSSYSRNVDNAVEFPLEGTIAGFSEGIIGMQEGGERRVIIPPELGYGEQGAPPRVPGNATLHFHIELLSIRDICISPVDLPEGAPRFEDFDAATITLRDDGLGVQEVSEGTGRAIEDDTGIVRVRYSLWLNDGCLFESSYASTIGDMTVSFPLQAVIPGFSEGMIGMKEGGARRVIIPPELGYGERGSPPRVPSNATLHLHVELLNVTVPGGG